MSSKKRPALGRGLDTLLGPAQSPVATVEPVQHIVHPVPVNSQAVRSLSIADLHPNPFQPRRHFVAEKIEELAASIIENGILQPLVVRRAGDEFQIVAGERRWRAAQRAGLMVVPAIVRDYTDTEMLALALIENLQREDLNPVEEALAYRQLMDEFNFTQEQVADRVGKSRVSVTNGLRLLRLPQQLLDWIQDGSISAGHARAMLSLESEALQMALAREIMHGGLSVREAERRVRRLIKAPNPNPKAPAPQVQIQTQALEEKLCLHLGLQVRILPKSNSEGRVEVMYSSLDEFQRFFDHLGISLEQEL